MKTTESSYEGLLINGFWMLFIQIIIIPALTILNFIFLDNEELLWAAISIFIIFLLLFILILPGYFSQEPNEARVMLFFGKSDGT